jgi:hypothetical protein
LRRRQVGLSILGWFVGVIVGLGLFIALFISTWPQNFEAGAGGIIITSIFLAMLAFIGGGSLWLLVKDTLRLLRADRSIIVITPQVYCKQDGDKIDLVPLEEIGYLTSKGSRAPATHSSWATYRSTTSAVPPEDRQVSAGATVGRMFGFRRKPRGPISIAFVDLRTDKKITVADDYSYGHPYELGETLHAYVEARLRSMEEEARKR